MNRFLVPLVLLLALPLSAEKRRARLEVPEELASAETVAIKWARNRVSKNPLTIGTSAVTGYRPGWTHGSHGDSTAFPGVSSSRERRRYSFQVEGWDCRCEATAATDGGIRASQRLDCTFIHPEGGREWKLEMQDADAMMTGDLMSGDDAILFRPVAAKIGPLKIAGGYVLKVDRQPIGLLEVVHPPQLRLNASVGAEHRHAIAAASAAILLNVD